MKRPVRDYLAALDATAATLADPLEIYAAHGVMVRVWRGGGIPASHLYPQFHPTAWAAVRADREAVEAALDERIARHWPADEGAVA